MDVEGSSVDDAMFVFGSNIGGEVGMDNDGDTDLAVSAPGRISLIDGFGNDRLSATSVLGSPSFMPVTLDGGEATTRCSAAIPPATSCSAATATPTSSTRSAAARDVVSGGAGTSGAGASWTYAEPSPRAR
jgi:hypothetical protein